MMRKKRKSTRLLQNSVSLLGVGVLFACGYGPVKPKEDKKALLAQTPSSAPADPAKTAVVTNDAVARGPQTFTLKADYKIRPVDVIIIRDSGTRTAPVSGRIDDAITTLGSTLWNLSTVVGGLRVAVFDHVYPPSAPNATTPGISSTAPIVDRTNDKGVMDAGWLSAADFQASLKSRVQAAGGRGGSALPGTLLAKLLAESEKPNGGEIHGLFRPDTFWAILYISNTKNPADPFVAEEVIELLKKKNPNAFAVSALVPDRGGCTIEETDPIQKTLKDGENARDLELDLQSQTGGLFGSICAKSFVKFMQDFASAGTGTTYFELKLPAAMKPESIKISVSGVDIKDYRYKPKSDILEVTTLVKSGSEVIVTAEPADAEAETIVSKSQVDDVHSREAGQLPPDELDFIKNTLPVLQRNCGNCHGAGRPLSLNAGYMAIKNYKTEIARRIDLVGTDAQKMPPSPAVMPAADIATIKAWATK